MPLPMTIGQVMDAAPYSEYEQGTGLIDTLNIYSNELDADPQLAKGNVSAFPIATIRIGYTTL